MRQQTSNLAHRQAGRRLISGQSAAKIAPESARARRFPTHGRSAIVSLLPRNPIHETVFMAIDPYSSCPCGSGKKFKWCCQPIYVNINRAFEQDAQGQHDAALRIMDEVTKEHGDNPEGWGQKAKLLYAHGKVEEAEEALEKAFALNRNYPYGLLLKAVFRYQEGEIAGALLLARRAADAYDPEARDYLAEAYSLVYECEMKLNRPVAARAALRIVLRCQPAAEEVREAFEQSLRRNVAAAGLRPPRVHADVAGRGRPAGGVGPGAPGGSVAATGRHRPRLRGTDEGRRRRRRRVVQPRPGPRLARRQRRRPGRPQPLPRTRSGRGEGDDGRDADGIATLRTGHGGIVRLPRVFLRLPVPRPAAGRRPGPGVAARRPADDAADAAGRRPVRHDPGADDRRR